MEVLNKKLQVRKLCKSFDNKKVLDNISFDVYEGEFLSVLGVSGCGKTTLLRILIGLETADSGEIIKGGQDISRLPSFERGMGIVFQNYALFPNMTVLQNVEYALKLHKETAATARQTALDTLEQIGMTDQLKKKPHQLSGGHRPHAGDESRHYPARRADFRARRNQPRNHEGGTKIHPEKIPCDHAVYHP